MTNEQRAEALVQRYGFQFSAIPKEEIRRLIQEEIDSYHPGSSEYIRLLCGYLYCTGDISDVPLMEQAKYGINMDVGCMVDGEWIESLKNGGVAANYIRTREDIIQSFIDYYTDFFKATDLDELW